MESLRKLRKSCKHNRNINGVYNEKLHYNCIQQLSTLRLKSYEISTFAVGRAYMPTQEKKSLRKLGDLGGKK